MSESDTDFEALAAEIHQDPVAASAYRENDLRRAIGSAFDSARLRRQLSIRAMAREMSTSVSQVQRLLHRELGGSLTLRTVCAAAQALGLHIDFEVRPVEQVHAIARPDDAQWKELAMVSNVIKLGCRPRSAHGAGPWTQGAKRQKASAA